MSKTRNATIKDSEVITKIYNDAILNTVATFDTEPKTATEQKVWFENHDASHPVLVAEQDRVVVGWASLSKYSDRCAYSGTAEASLYVKSDYRRKGVGRQLLRALLEEGEKKGLHTVIARITEENIVSIHLFASEGFNDVGVMKEVGLKFGRLLDVRIMQRIFKK